MSTIHHHLAAVLVATFALAAPAQAQQAAGASAPMAGSMMSSDCAKSQAKHDHGAEKGTPRSQSKSGPCMTATAASAPTAAASSSKKLKHDHAKTHKTM